jgi:hypothetical protein
MLVDTKQYQLQSKKKKNYDLDDTTRMVYAPTRTHIYNITQLTMKNRKNIFYYLWIALCGLSGYIVTAQTDTVYFNASGSTISMAWKSNVKTITADAILSDIGQEGSAWYVYVNSGTTQVGRFRYTSYAFIIDGVATSRNIDSIRIAINNLNSGVFARPKLLKTIKIVSALPNPLEPRTEYIVGDTNLINITGLNGNDARLWQLVINGVGSSSSTAVLRLEMSVNSITTSSAYSSTNSNVTQAGGFSAQALTSSFIIGNISVINTGADVHFGSNITMSPCVVNASTFRTMSAVGSYARTSAIYGQTASGGTWRDATTNITTLQITTESPSTTVFKPGTVIELLQLDK